MPKVRRLTEDPVMFGEQGDMPPPAAAPVEPPMGKVAAKRPNQAKMRRPRTGKNKRKLPPV